jgi:hypothetical protein
VLKEARKTAPPRLKALAATGSIFASRTAQVRLIEAAARSGKPVVVVIVAGSAVLVEEWRARASAILQTFYRRHGRRNALARLLFGEVSPSGRLPFTVASDAEHYPFFDRDARAITYDYWHGYAKLLRDGVQPRYAFGHGLTYSSVASAPSRSTTAAIGWRRSYLRNDGTCSRRSRAPIRRLPRHRATALAARAKGLRKSARNCSPAKRGSCRSIALTSSAGEILA